jgi:hypothetical protein
MEPIKTHNIAEQNSSYRRGVVLGLTMAEVGILIIFTLLLLLGMNLVIDEKQRKSMEGKQLVNQDSLSTLIRSDSIFQEIKKTLEISDNPTVNEIQMLIRAIKEASSRPEGQSALKEMREALKELSKTKDEILKSGVDEEFLNRIEQQNFRIANQENLLKNYESKLAQLGQGQGERPCWVKPDGTIEYLYDVVLTSEGIKMREYKSENRARERALLPMPVVDSSEILTPGEFLRRTRPLFDYSSAENCRFFVVVYDATGPTEKELYKMLLRTVEGHFYKRIDRGPAPF